MDIQTGEPLGSAPKRGIEELLVAAWENRETDPLQALGFASVAFMRAVERHPETATPNPLAGHAAELGLFAVRQVPEERRNTAMWEKRVLDYSVVLHDVPSSHNGKISPPEAEGLRAALGELSHPRKLHSKRRILKGLQRVIRSTGAIVDKTKPPESPSDTDSA